MFRIVQPSLAGWISTAGCSDPARHVSAHGEAFIPSAAEPGTGMPVSEQVQCSEVCRT